MGGDGPTGHTQGAQPIALPGGASRPELLAALYGEFVPHPWRDVDIALDPHFLFHTRSMAMRWLTDAGRYAIGRPSGAASPITGHAKDIPAEPTTAGLWDVWDAGETDVGAAAPAPVLWVQAGIDPIPPGQPLPVQPLLCCARDVANRIGTLDLRAAQVRLPLQHLTSPTDSELPALLTAGWFTDTDPDGRTPIQMTLDSGPERALLDAADRMATWMFRADQNVFVCEETYSETDHSPVALTSFAKKLWAEPVHHRASFTGTLAEWSLDALGWLASFVGDVAVRHGVGTDVVFTATRTA